MEMKDLMKALRKHLKMVVAVILLFTLCGGVIGYSISPTYEAETDLLINSAVGNAESTAPVMSEIDTNLRLIDTYKQIMKSHRMVSRVNSELGTSYTRSTILNNIKIEAGNGSQIITIIATENTEKRAATLANTYAVTFQEEIKTLMNLDNITILKEVTAGVDTRKVMPPLPYYVVISLVMGILISLMLIITKEVFFPFLDSKQKVESTLKVPLLGSIITTKSGSFSLGSLKKVRTSLLSELKFPGAVRDDFSRLAANVHYLTKQKNIKTILLTSPSSGDGKTFVGCNLAVKLAMNGQRTLFIDADLRKSDGRILFNLPERKGLTSIISGFYQIDEIIQRTSTENLSFISTGPLPPNPAQFLQSKSMDKMLDDLKDLYDVIIIDTPALTMSDAVSLLPTVDGCIYIADTLKTKEEKALQSLESLKKVGGDILGVVLNAKKKRLVRTG